MKKLSAFSFFIFLLALFSAKPAHAVIQNTSWCTPPNTPLTNWTISAPCVMYENTNGPANADITIQAGTTLTLHNGKSLIWYPGRKITVQTGAHIIINNGAQITQKHLCVNSYTVNNDPSALFALGPGQTVTIGTTLYYPSTNGHLKLTYKTDGAGVTLRRTYTYNGATLDYSVPNSATVTTTTIGTDPSTYSTQGSASFTLTNLSSTNTIYMHYAELGIVNSGNPAPITKTWTQAVYALAKIGNDPVTGQANLYQGMDTAAAVNCASLGASYVDMTQINDRNMVALGGGPTPPATYLATTYSYLMNLGMAVSSINSGSKVVQAANNNVQVIGDNLEVCTSSPCPGSFTFPNAGYGNIYAGGAVAIGTTTSTYPLDVVGSVHVNNTTGETIYVGESAQTGATRFKVRNTSTNGRQYGVVSTGGSSGWGAGKFVITDNGTDAASDNPRLTIDNTGNVAIGTTNPSYTLDVKGTGLSVYGATNPKLYIGADSTSQNGMRSFWDTTNNQFSMQTYYGNVAQNSIVLQASGGKVGIGTSSPGAYALDVSGTTNSTYLHSSTNDSWFPYTNGQNYFRGVTNAFNGTWYDENNTGYYVDPASTTSLNSVYAGYLQATGNINLGNSALYGMAYIQGYGAITYYPGGYNTNPGHIFNTGNGAGGWANRLVIGGGTSAVDSYFVNTDLGIGTTTPAQALHVVGSIAVMPTSAGQTGYAIISSAQRGGSIADADLGLGDENGRIMTLNSYAARINSTVDSSAGTAYLYVKGTGTGTESTSQPAGTWGAIINNSQNTSGYNGLLVKTEWNAVGSTVIEAGVDLQGGAYSRKFRVTGDGNADLTGCLRYNGGTAGTCLSDATVKQNIQPLIFDQALEKLTNLKPSTFQYKDEPQTTFPGLIAQDVQKFAPELVVNGVDGHLNVKYGDIQWLTIEAIQEQKKEVDQLKTTVNNQQQQIDDLKKEIEAIKAKL